MQNRQFCNENIIKAPVLQYYTVHIQQFFTGYCRVSMFARYQCFARKTHKLLQVCKQVATNFVHKLSASCVCTSVCSHVACCNKFTTTCNGASVAQWSVRSPSTSEVAGSILSENFLNVARTQCSTRVKRVSQHSAESRGFSPGTLVSSHREVDRVG